jgi:hypothetical protein
VERETDAVTDETHEAFAGRGFHDGNGLWHNPVPVVCRMALKFRRRRRKAMPQVPLIAGQTGVTLLPFNAKIGAQIAVLRGWLLEDHDHSCRKSRRRSSIVANN